jgi:Methylamine utilisation protein MauE
LLAVVLLLSGVAKLHDPADTASVFDQLQLPKFLHRLRAPALLPWAELALAAALVLLPGGWYVAATTAALVLFASYFVIVARALRFPYPMVCGCFGRLGLGWITTQTLVRNGVLLGVALVAWVDSWRAEGVAQRLGDLGSDWWWLAGVGLTLVTTTLVVRDSKPPPWTPEVEDPENYPAAPIPYALLDGPDGPFVLWRVTDAGARLLVFTDHDDEASRQVLARIPEWEHRLAPVTVHVVTRGEWSSLASSHPEQADRFWGDPDDTTRVRLGVGARPGAVLLGTDRFFAGGPVSGLEEIEELVDAAAEELRLATSEPSDA